VCFLCLTITQSMRVYSVMSCMVFNPKFGIFKQKFLNKEIFSNSPKFRRTNAPHATTPLVMFLTFTFLVVNSKICTISLIKFYGIVNLGTRRNKSDKNNDCKTDIQVRSGNNHSAECQPCYYGSKQRQVQCGKSQYGITIYNRAATD